MFGPKAWMVLLLALRMALASLSVQAQEPEQSERELMYQRYLEFPSYIKGGSIAPHWMADGNSFWYAEGMPDRTVIYKVDPKANTKMLLFDTARLREALTDVLGHEPPYAGLPFANFSFLDDETAVKFSAEGWEFVLRLDSYELSAVPPPSQEEKNRLVPQGVRSGGLGHLGAVREVLSPDGAWFATVRDHNLFLRSTDEDPSVQLTTGGTDGYEPYPEGQPWVKWSPDSLKLATGMTDWRKVSKIPIVHWLKQPEEVEWTYYPTAGGPYPHTELYIVDIKSRRKIPLQGADQPGQRYFIIDWRADSAELIFLQADHYGKNVELMAADAVTGATRILLTEETETYVRPWLLAGGFLLLEDGERFIWMSERDGWRQIYLYGLDGTLIRRLAEGPFPVARVVSVDETTGWVYFTAQADPERIYDTYLYRVSLEGGAVTQLTQADGQHDFPVFGNFSNMIQFTPSKEFFLETHSSVDRPPVVELRNADGTLLQIVSKANIDGLSELRWSPPEEFVVKADDGRTSLYGILYKPYDFDPEKKYAVIDFIHAAPGSLYVPRTFVPDVTAGDPQALAQLGFIVFVVDGRGTGGRGKAFQDTVYGNIGRYEIPDHVAALRQLAEERSYMDLSRVGIKGGSYGGYMAVRAMLAAPEVYHVGVASAPISDMAEHYGNWIFFGPPTENSEAYEYASNLRLAGNLKGNLLIIHGTSDQLVPFSHTMKMIEAFEQAGKTYDLVVLPELGHLDREVYSGRHIHRYFQEHLKP